MKIIKDKKYYDNIIKRNAYKGPMTFEDIAEQLGVTRQRVWMIYCKAISKLKYFIACKRLKNKYAFDEIDYENNITY